MREGCKYRCFWAVLVAVAACMDSGWCVATAPPKPTVYTCRRAKGEISIDGKLTEAAWRHAVLLTNFVLPPKNLRATTQTKAWLLWDDTNLYLAAELEDRDIYGYHKGHDPDFGCDDILELFLRPSRNKPPYWEFHVTPTGATRDYFYPRRFYGSDEDSLAYESGMTAAVTVEGSLENWEDRDSKWTAEVAIPLTALENTMKARPTPGSNWTFLLSRYDYSVYLKGGVELSTAFPLEQLNFHWLEDYGTLHFE